MENVKSIETLLIANRGEIARRIQKTAKQMGIKTVAIYGDADVNALFVKEADIALPLGGSAPSETYLDVEKVLKACVDSGANAVHPGYGFLSENSDFAKAVIDKGLVWVGPSPDVIEKMGDKLSAKELMEKSDVPVLKSYKVDGPLDHEFIKKEIGYPLLIKASAGGGGKGMRVVDDRADLGSAIESAKREAQGAFGDGTVFLEKWLTSTRHVEIQIVGDNHGNINYCFERECSIQRRHQKVIEEAPSPAVSDDLRQRMGEAAVKASKAMNYSSVGTFEFLVSGEEFYFLEVNTRLQVEHPVTEEITGLDLVREQIRIAEGEVLGYDQTEIEMNGCAIEVRLYAENPSNDFLPSPGKIAVWEMPDFPGIRFDTGVEAGSEIGIDYDPMIAKVISHAPTRKEAAKKLALALENTKLQGIISNKDFLIQTLRSPEYLAGDTTTDFIERVNPPRTKQLDENAVVNALIGVSMYTRAIRQREAKVLSTISRGWRNSRMPPEKRVYTVNSKEIVVEYDFGRGNEITFTVGDLSQKVKEIDASESAIDLVIDQKRCRFDIKADGLKFFVHNSEITVDIEELDRFPDQKLELKEGDLTAPMPSLVQKVKVKEGEEVVKGQVLLILESMKMELKVTAPKDGIVSEIHVKPGRHVDNGQILASLTAVETVPVE